MSHDVMPAVEAARDRFVKGCQKAWEEHSQRLALAQKPKRPRAIAIPVGKCAGAPAYHNFPPAGAKWALAYQDATAPTREAYLSRMETVRATLLSDMRAALPGITIPTFEEAARRSRYWEMEPV